MKEYIKKIEKLVDQKLNEKPKRKVKEAKGFMSKKNQQDDESGFEDQIDLIHNNIMQWNSLMLHKKWLLISLIYNKKMQ